MSREWRYVNSRFICKDGDRYYGIYINAAGHPLVEHEELALLKAADGAHITRSEGFQRIFKKLWHHGDHLGADIHREPKKLSREANVFLDAYVVRKLL